MKIVFKIETNLDFLRRRSTTKHFSRLLFYYYNKQLIYTEALLFILQIILGQEDL